MKTANELFKEFYNIPLKDRINKTSHDYIYDYMKGEVDKLKYEIDKLNRKSKENDSIVSVLKYGSY
jgi:hypothetical protein